MEENQFMNLGAPETKSSFNNQAGRVEMSFGKLSRIARKDIETGSNKGLLSFLETGSKYTFHHKINAMQKSKLSKGSNENKGLNEPAHNQKQSAINEAIGSNPALSSQGQTSRARQISYSKLRSDLIKRDQSSHPLKYKIVSQMFGLGPQKIYAMKEAQILKAEQQYRRKKGAQYLRDSRHRCAKSIQRVKTQQIPRINQSAERSPERSRDYVHQIFKDVARVKAIKSAKMLKERRQYQAVIGHLQQNQQILGQIVYQKVRKHLSSESASKDFSHRISSEQGIDDALINFLKVKIRKVQAMIGRS